MRLRSALGATLIVLTATGVPFAISASATQAPEPTYLVRPAPGSQVSPTRDYFVIDAEPGDSVRQAVEIRNTSDDPITLSIAPVDAYTKAGGGVGYELPSDPVDEVGRWIFPARDEIEVAPGRRIQLRVTIEVPRSAREGVNLGALSIQEVGAILDEEVPDRTVVAVQVNTPGTRNADLFISGIRPVARPDALYLEIGVSNEGSGFTTAVGTLRLPEEVFESDVQIRTFVPGTAINYPVRWTVDPKPGTYTAEVTLEYGNAGQVAEWNGSVAIGAELVDELARLRGDTPALEEGGTSNLTVIAIVVGAAAVIGATLLVGRRRKPRPVTVPAGGAQTPEPAPATRAEPAPAVHPEPKPTEPTEATPAAHPEPAPTARAKPAEPAGAEPAPDEAPAPAEPALDAGAQAAPVGRPEEVTPAQGSSATKTPAKASEDKTTAAKSTAKKSTAKKTTRKKSTAKKTTRKGTSRKTTAKQTGAKTSARKTTTAKKTAAESATTKKPSAKKTTRRKNAGNAVGSTTAEDRSERSPDGPHNEGERTPDDPTEP